MEMILAISMTEIQTELFISEIGGSFSPHFTVTPQSLKQLFPNLELQKLEISILFREN